MSGSIIIAWIIGIVLIGYLIKDYKQVSNLITWITFQEGYITSALEGESY